MTGLCDQRKEIYFNYFIKSLNNAAKNMDPHYFQIPVAGEGEDELYRERVYCYELYHQLRLELGDSFPYKLYGEVDKSGHPIIREAKKPDFIVHEPGNMDNNLLIMEVKSIVGAKNENGLNTDLEKLRLFLDEYKYYRAIMLIYGSENGKLTDKIETKISEVKADNPDIRFAWHPSIKRGVYLI